MTLQAGNLRQEIRFEKRAEVQDSVGGITITWSTFATVRASIEPLTGREFFEAQSINERTAVRIRCYFLSGLDTDMRIVDVGTNSVYDITAILDFKMMGTELQIMATITNDESV